MAKILVIGTGSWGTALAQILLENKHQVYMYGIDKKQIADLKLGWNKSFFTKKMTYKPTCVSNNLESLLLKKPDYIILAIPSTAIESTFKIINKHLVNKPIIINTTKGLNEKTNNPWLIDIKKIVKNKTSGVVSLVGPSFASDVYNHEKTAVNIVSNNIRLAKKVSQLIGTTWFRCSLEKNAIAAEYCAALKNVMAIACGIASQLNISINTRAIMFTQAVKEIGIILKTKKLPTSTLFNYCGVGDIFLTCTDSKSRNFKFGQLIAKVGIKRALKNNKNVVEGYHATKVAKALITELKIKKSPIISSLYEVLYQNASAKDFIDNVINHIII